MPQGRPVGAVRFGNKGKKKQKQEDAFLFVPVMRLYKGTRVFGTF